MDMFNLANKLTLARILAIPLLIVLLYFPRPATCLVAFFFFIFVALTDVVDGIIARRQNTITNLGKFLDPLADKLLITSVLIMLATLDWIQAWVAITIIGRELAVTGLRAIAADQGVVIAADKYGKLKTIIQIVAMCPLILHFPTFGIDPNPLGQIVLYAALVMTIFSGVNYFRNFYRTLRDSGKISARR
jgi:CDP-diacylglycerol--glycerol-3-phosphate 3-phosphatidyltransferase